MSFLKGCSSFPLLFGSSNKNKKAHIMRVKEPIGGLMEQQYKGIKLADKEGITCGLNRAHSSSRACSKTSSGFYILQHPYPNTGPFP